ncbi:MAG TPA: hypothetical protein VM534_11070 [Thermoanaerobaculia bacterium]|nr:hypothetical protein [Thermoanaerobaculia bacterium]
MRSRGKSPVVAAVMMVAGLSLFAPAVFAADLLRLVPEKAVAVGMVEIAELRDTPATRRLFEDTDRIAADGDAARFMEEAGLDPARDVDRLLLAVYPDPKDATEGEMLVVFEGRFDQARLAAAAVARGALPQASAGRTYYLIEDAHDEGEDEEETAAVCFVSASLVLAGTEPAVVDALARLASGGSAFSSASGIGREMNRIEEGSTAWLLLDVQRSARLKSSPNERAGGGVEDQITPVVRKLSTVALWARGTSDQLRFGATAVTFDAETRELLEDFLRGLTAGWRMAAQEKNPEWVAVLRQIEITQVDDGVQLNGSIPLDLLKKQAGEMAEKR